MEGLTSLFNEGTLKVLSYLGEHEKAYVTQLQEDLSISYETIYRARKRLDKFGLIELDEGEGGRGSKNWFYLNEKGKKIFDLIKSIEKVVEESAPQI